MSVKNEEKPRVATLRKTEGSDTAIEEAKARGDEKEPLFDDESVGLGDIDEALESHAYPTTTTELVEAYGDHDLEIQGGKKPLGDLLSSTDDQTYDSAEGVRRRILGLIGR